MGLKHYILFAIIGFAIIFILLPEQTNEIHETSMAGGITAHLPDPTTNNAVAGTLIDGQPYLYSFSGLGEDKGQEDIHARAYVINIDEQFVRELPPVPGGKDRLASVAITVGEIIYVIGGYAVAEDGHEVSTPEVFAFDPTTEVYSEKAPMPNPVDDTVAFSYLDRYIYLISGWHDTGNVSDVQVYDSTEDIWFPATPYPGSPVFGHAGGIVGNRIVIADGVAVVGQNEEGRNQFGATDEAYLGTINPDNPAVISWQELPPHPGNPLYRMAASGTSGESLVLFAGGSDNPYNYDGIGYDQVPSKPSASVFGFDVAANEWRVFGQKQFATMDHRGLVELGGRFYIIGGMIKDQEVTEAVSWFSLETEND